MSSNEGLNAPRNLGGVLARIAETPASDAVLARKGVPSGCPADVIIIEAGESDEK